MQLSHKNLTPRDDQRKLRNDYEDVSRLKITRYEHIQQVAYIFFTREKKTVDCCCESEASRIWLPSG